jgi:hypothetical protein
VVKQHGHSSALLYFTLNKYDQLQASYLCYLIYTHMKSLEAKSRRPSVKSKALKKDPSQTVWKPKFRRLIFMIVMGSHLRLCAQVWTGCRLSFYS